MCLNPIPSSLPLSSFTPTSLSVLLVVAGSQWHHGGSLSAHSQVWLRSSTSDWQPASPCAVMVSTSHQQNKNSRLFYPWLIAVLWGFFPSWSPHHACSCMCLSVRSLVFVPLSLSYLPLSPPSFYSEEFRLKCLNHLLVWSRAVLLDLNGSQQNPITNISLRQAY